MVRRGYLIKPRVLIAIVEAFLIGCVVLLVVGCSGVRSEAPQEEQQEHTEGTREESLPQTMAEGTQSIAEECPSNAECAPRNRHPVPEVVGMTVPEASRTLSRSGYACAIWAEKGGEHAGPRRVVAQKEKPGSKAFEAQLIHLTVSKPYREGYHHPSKGLLPPDCLDQRDPKEYPR